LKEEFSKNNNSPWSQRPQYTHGACWPTWAARQSLTVCAKPSMALDIECQYGRSDRFPCAQEGMLLVLNSCGVQGPQLILSLTCSLQSLSASTLCQWERISDFCWEAFKKFFFFFHFYCRMYSVMFISGVQQSESVIHTLFKESFPICGKPVFQKKVDGDCQGKRGLRLVAPEFGVPGDFSERLICQSPRQSCLFLSTAWRQALTFDAGTTPGYRCIFSPFYLSRPPPTSPIPGPFSNLRG